MENSARTVLFHRGAEADLYRDRVGPWDVIVKKRVPKAYRDKTLDAQIRKERTITEASLLHESKLCGVSAPTIVAIDLDDTSITMSYIPGRVARDAIDNTSKKDSSLFFNMLGQQIALLHQGGISHGDMTTSNVIISENVRPVIIDFGMAHRSTQLEDQAVDLHLMERSIMTSHTTGSIPLLRALLKGYQNIVGEQMAHNVNVKRAEIARRGRYFSIR